jgi:hypothetical protein
MCGEKGAHLRFGVSRCRLVVFIPVAEYANTRVKSRNIEGVIGAGIYGQADRRAFRPRLLDHCLAVFRRGRPPRQSGSRSVPPWSARGYHRGDNKRLQHETAGRNVVRPNRDLRHEAPTSHPSIPQGPPPPSGRRNQAATDSATLRRHRTPGRAGLAAATAVDATRTEAVDGEGHIPQEAS